MLALITNTLPKVTDVVEVEIEVEDELVDEVTVAVVTVLVVTVGELFVIVLVILPRIPLFDETRDNIRRLTCTNKINRKDYGKSNTCN